LRSSAKRNPANHHFIIFHEKDGEPRSAEERAEIFDVNLNVYNLISIFLTTVEIKAFIEIINAANGDEFDKAMQGLVTSKIDRKYYLVGTIASGKSSVLDGLRCFTTYEEFGGRVPAAMYQDDRTLTSDEQKIVDDFLFPQLIKKNGNMIRMNSGIRITDRAYLDLFAFSKSAETEIKRKAVEMKNRLKHWGKPLESGHIFFLVASKESLKERLARRGTKRVVRGKVRFNTKALVQQEKELRTIYRVPPGVGIDTTDSTVGETARTIARIILLEKYDPFDFTARLDEVIKGGGKL
jgi:broad-specificity NMP kinase